MILARVVGTATATVRHASLAGQKMVVCQPVDGTGASYGVPWIAVDRCGAGHGALVIVSTDGDATRAFVGDAKSPLRNMIVGIVDEEKRP